jgi:hypothetical protein
MPMRGEKEITYYTATTTPKTIPAKTAPNENPDPVKSNLLAPPDFGATEAVEVLMIVVVLVGAAVLATLTLLRLAKLKLALTELGNKLAVGVDATKFALNVENVWHCEVGPAGWAGGVDGSP